MTITFVSVIVALAIGGVEALGSLATNLVSKAGSRLGALRYLIIGTFVACWLISAIVYRVNQYDDLMLAFIDLRQEE